MVNSNISLDYNSTLEGSHLIFWCRDGLLPENVMMAQCTDNATWMPNVTELVCSAPVGKFLAN